MEFKSHNQDYRSCLHRMPSTLQKKKSLVERQGTLKGWQYLQYPTKPELCMKSLHHPLEAAFLFPAAASSPTSSTPRTTPFTLPTQTKFWSSWFHPSLFQLNNNILSCKYETIQSWPSACNSLYRHPQSLEKTKFNCTQLVYLKYITPHM